MDKLFAHLPDILKSVTDPFSLLALITVVLGVVAYSVIRKSGSTKTAGLPGPIVALSIVAISLLALAFNVIRVGLRNTQPTLTPPQQIALQVTFTGKVEHTVAVTVPFSVSSGQLNVGCGDSASTSVSWTLPPGARDVNESASWQRADGLKSNTQSAIVQGSVVTATGSISGQDRQWTGNCPGGGHGELVLTGSYVIDKVSGSDNVSLPAFQSPVFPGALTAVDLPLPSAMTSFECEVSAADSKDQISKAAYAIEISPDHPKSITQIRKEGTRQIETTLAGTKILIKVL